MCFQKATANNQLTICPKDRNSLLLNEMYIKLVWGPDKEMLCRERRQFFPCIKLIPFTENLATLYLQLLSCSCSMDAHKKCEQNNCIHYFYSYPNTLQMIYTLLSLTFTQNYLMQHTNACSWRRLLLSWNVDDGVPNVLTAFIEQYNTEKHSAGTKVFQSSSNSY